MSRAISDREIFRNVNESARMKKLFLPLILFVFYLSTGFTASANAEKKIVDCKKLTTTEEKLICSSIRLRKLDQKLSQNIAVISLKYPKIKNALTTWIRDRRERCQLESNEFNEEEKVRCLSLEYKRFMRMMLWDSYCADQEDCNNPEPVYKRTEFNEINVMLKKDSSKTPLRVRETIEKDDPFVCLTAIDIFQKGRIAPFQSIEPEDNCGGTEVGGGNFISFDDYNFDGILDLEIFEASASGMTNHFYTILLFDNKSNKFEETSSLPGGGFPDIDSKNKLIHFHSNGGAAGMIGTNASYRFENGKYVIVTDEQRDKLFEHCLSKFDCYDEDQHQMNRKPICKQLKDCYGTNRNPDKCDTFIRISRAYDQKGTLKSEEATIGLEYDEKDNWKKIDENSICSEIDSWSKPSK